MAKPDAKKAPYRAVIFMENEPARNVLKKILEKRGYEVSTYDALEQCPNFASPESHDCVKEKRCADIVIMGRHMYEVRAFDFLERQAQGKCKLPMANKLIISSIFEELDDARAKELGVTIMYLPFSVAALEKWLDGCEERLAILG
jgi:CheY-like chemotaxis protein